MADVLTKKQRSFCMSRIKRGNTKPEISLRKALWRNDLRYRVKNRLPGRPDIIFSGLKIAIFVDGCFWHGCPEHCQMPKTNSTFWKNKLKKNMKRDQIVNQLLMEEGWTVLRFWEHEINANLNDCVERVLKAYRLGQLNKTV